MLFLVLKLTKVIAWSWFWVFSPVVFMAGFLLGLLITRNITCDNMSLMCNIHDVNILRGGIMGVKKYNLNQFEKKTCEFCAVKNMCVSPNPFPRSSDTTLIAKNGMS